MRYRDFLVEQRTAMKNHDGGVEGAIKTITLLSNAANLNRNSLGAV
jgi:hypothetical protein